MTYDAHGKYGEPYNQATTAESNWSESGSSGPDTHFTPKKVVKSHDPH